MRGTTKRGGGNAGVEAGEFAFVVRNRTRDREAGGVDGDGVAFEEVFDDGIEVTVGLALVFLFGDDFGVCTESFH